MIEKMEEPTSDSMFYSPTFKRYESVTFYANLLSILKQYTQIIDQCPSTIRKLVWSHIFQLLRQPQRPCDNMFTPVINSWLNEKSVDLMDIETYFAAFTQAQVENPSIFPALPNVSGTYSIPGISAPATSVRVPNTHLSSMLSTTSSSTSSSSSQTSSPITQSNNNNNNINNFNNFNINNSNTSKSNQTPNQTPIGSPKSPLRQHQHQHQQPQSQHQTPQQSPQLQLQQILTPLPANPQQNHPSVWSTELSSVFSQLALLQSWSTGLDRLSSNSRDSIWRTCRYIQQFINYDKTSFVKTIHKWTIDPIPNLSHITVLFAAIGYLKEMGVIRGEFNYTNNLNSPVFAAPSSSSSNNNNHSETTPPMSPSSYDLSSDNTPDYSVSPPSSPRQIRSNSVLSSPGTPYSDHVSAAASATRKSTTSNNNSNNNNIHQLPILSMSNYSSPVHTPSTTPQYLSPRPLSDVPISPKSNGLQLPSLNMVNNNNSTTNTVSGLKKRKSIEDLLQSSPSEHQKMLSNLIKLEQNQKLMQQQQQGSIINDDDDEDDIEDETDQELQELKKMSEETIIKVNSYHNVSSSPLKKQRNLSGNAVDHHEHNHSATTSSSASSPNSVESRSSISSILCS
ncbi:hypothetical protein PPL_00149 [Heterostelium album PN500]|uniref:Uncharacterized protein n=1 Tax=Heterostelium pallidum (strain ATCC 26659 / Pp 5 / PN500) TaxID=670386 RepID=D3AVN4_HETP5|nr:hypothetical protein PPL_00149 [Heterostelium album PN500]EFA86357.1 hypothetical protein PPL_00149 [Heterostelium album PN500]|eukprot:XP_020438462.1 hypothetical protein PPL_00149 [Heterostelium album PN500]